MSLAAYHGTLWLCEPARLRQLAARVLAYRPCPTAREVVEARRAELERMQGLAAKARPGKGVDAPDLFGATRPIRAVRGKVGVIPVLGMIDQRMTPDLMKAGGTSAESISAAFQMMLRDSQIGAIVLEIDSPGGSVFGSGELADEIYDARGKGKPIYAIANSLAASAALWIGTAADQLFSTPGGQAGSVGVYALHVDESKAMETDGIKVTPVFAGKYKVEGAPFAPFTDEARGALQEQVNYTYDKFLNALKRHRGVSLDHVRDHFGQGRLLNAEQALAARMIDRVMTFSELLGRLTGADTASTNKQSTKDLSRKHEHEKRKTDFLLGNLPTQVTSASVSAPAVSEPATPPK